MQPRYQQHMSLFSSQAAPGAMHNASFQQMPNTQCAPSQQGELGSQQNRLLPYASASSTWVQWFVATHMPSKHEPPQQFASALHVVPTAPH